MTLYAINLDRRPDRWDIFQERADNAGIECINRFSAIDGTKIDPNDKILNLFEGNRFGYRRGIVGAALSHLKLWELLIESDDDYFTIFEDDVQFVVDFGVQYKLLQDSLKKEPRKFVAMGVTAPYTNWDTYYLKNHGIKLITPNMIDRIIWGGLFGYTISKEFARQLVNDVYRYGIKVPIDTFVMQNYQKIEMLYPEIVFSPAVVHSSSKQKLDSDIQHDHQSLRKKRYRFICCNDSFGNDISHIGPISLINLIEAADSDNKCVGFNSYGFLKHTIDENNLIYLEGTKLDGIYIKIVYTP